jgi:hypothetical protein
MKKAIIFWGAIAAAIPLVSTALGGLGMAIKIVSEGIAVLRTLMIAQAAGTWAAIAPWLAWALAIGAAGLAIALITEDIMAFRAGKKSLIGELVGDIPAVWEKFMEQVMAVSKLLNPIRTFLGLPEVGLTEEEIGKRAGTWKSTKDLQMEIHQKTASALVSEGREQEAAEMMFEPDKWNSIKASPEAMARAFRSEQQGASSNVTTNITVNQTLPAGTPEEHKKTIKQYTEDLFGGFMDKQLRFAGTNFQVVP